jgi:hypothetical protein
MDDDASFASPGFDDSDWLDVEMGPWEPQLPYERDEQVYPVALWYRASFTVVDVPTNPRLMIDGFSGSGHRLFVNGEEITDEGRRSWLDAEIREVDLLLKEGRNVVAVRLIVERKTDGMLDLLKVLGDFAVEDGAIMTAPTEMPFGGWTDKGYPFYSGTGVYRTSIDVASEFIGSGRVWLDADCGEDVLEVSVNGGEPMVAPWHPYRVDVTDHLREGENTFEIKVTNTLLNILEGEAQPSGLFKPPRLIHEHKYILTVDGDQGTGDGRLS